MKATNSIRQPQLFGNLIILLVTFLSFSFNSLVAKNNAKLSQVFTSEAAPNDKQVLKLYDDNSYEFLHFVIVHKKPKVIREQGSYVLESKKLKLKSRNKKGVIDHPKHYFFLSEKGLFKSRAHAKKVNASPALATNKDSKYYETFYIDSIFGKVSNDQKVFNKLADPEWAIQERKLKDDQEEKMLKKELERMDSIYNSNLIRDSLDLLLWQSEIKKLKAVIIVSDVDGDEPDGWWNKEYIAEQKKNAKYLREHGVLVKEFYHPNTKWKDIVKACQGANIFIYSGHGSNQGINHPSGGLCLVDGIHGADEIKSEFKLHKNALVIFNSACYSAGSSSSDVTDIGYREAQLRTGEYAYPFLINCGGAYIADCNFGLVTTLFNSLFKGKTLVEIYKKSIITNEKIEPIATYNYITNYNVCVSSRPVESGFKNITTYYSNGKKTVEKVKNHKGYYLSYVSKPNYSIMDLLKK
jgi:hypothetical protein